MTPPPSPSPDPAADSADQALAELVAIAEGIGRPARQRTTTYVKRAA
jgi:hypothetical protein